jgi:hypothetical protein
MSQMLAQATGWADPVALQALLTFGSPKQIASSWFCSHTVQAPAKPNPLRSHTHGLRRIFEKQP